MESRYVELTFEKAFEFYMKGGELKKFALQAFTEDEFKSFKHITSMVEVLKVLNIQPSEFNNIKEELEKFSKASAAAFKLNLIKKALNLGHKMDFRCGTIWHPNPSLVVNYVSDSEDYEKEVAKVNIDGVVYTVTGGTAFYGCNNGLGNYYSNSKEAFSNADTAFLGCATKEIAQHMSIYFYREIFEAKYGDTLEFEWIS